jgi:hypothetical protein
VLPAFSSPPLARAFALHAQRARSPTRAVSQVLAPAPTAQ